MSHTLHTLHSMSHTHYTYHSMPHTFTICLCCATGCRKRGRKKAKNLLLKDDPFCVRVGKRVHRLVKSRLLKGVSGRGRCVACYARSVTSPTSKKRRVEGGHAVPNVTRACNVIKCM